jgi:hypothetical protein
VLFRDVFEIENGGVLQLEDEKRSVLLFIDDFCRNFKAYLVMIIVELFMVQLEIYIDFRLLL